MATKEEAKFALNVIDQMDDAVNRMKHVARELTELLDKAQAIIDDPDQMQKLTNGLADVSDYTLSDLNTIRTNLTTARNWINNNL